MNTRDVAARAFTKHAALHPLTHYTGILSLHGLARLAVLTGESHLLDQARRRLLPFVRGEYDFPCNFLNYRCGGNGTAFLLWQGLLPEARETVHRYAEQLMHEAPRDAQGIVCMPSDPQRSKIWIDAAFAVTPFLLFAGLALDEDAYLEEAFQQTRKMVEDFRDPANGLLHQCRGFAGPGRLSEDHWSRGNGWGLLALAELVNYLPAAHPRRSTAEGLYLDLVQACLGMQDEQGVWHQELTDPLSYVETSGTGLILYAVGVGLAKGLLPADVRERFVAGLQGYLPYITPDSAVFHTCRGCLCPGDGSILAYEARAPLLNDPHAFGPVTLAFGQAWALGIHDLAPAQAPLLGEQQ